MRTFLLGATAAIALSGAACAADLRTPVFKSPPIVPAWSWTGCYGGGHAGYLKGQSQDWTPQTPGGPSWRIAWQP